MPVGSNSDDSNLRRAFRIIGTANVVIAAIGLTQLFVNVVGYVLLPASFIDQYGPFMRPRFLAMSIATGLLLVPLAYLGIQLFRRRRNAIMLCNILFTIEIVYFLVFWRTWGLGFSPFTPQVILSGLFNAGLALQVVTAYPVIGLILLNANKMTASAPSTE